MAFISFSSKNTTSLKKNYSSLFPYKNSNRCPVKKISHLFCEPEKSKLNEEIEAKDQDNNLNFVNEITTEMKMIEWPSLDRLFKQFVIVVISLVFSAIFIYSVDGVFASLSKFLFEGN